MSDFLSFRLPEEFLDDYRDRKPDWGFYIGGGNSLAELTFITKYSRLKDDGTKERWWEVCRRCIEGYYSILKDHCLANRTPWNDHKAQRSARDAFERMFVFKWMPPGRGLWMMGTEFVNGQGNSAALQNCAFVSTEKLSTHSFDEATLPFTRLMEMSMLGVGVGFDTRGVDKLRFHMPTGDPETFVIPDSREGWVESVGLLLASYFLKSRRPVEFDYSLIRLEGEPIRGFGGIAAGPGPLRDLHDMLRTLFARRIDERISSTDIADICNLIAKCVVSGNVRRSALIALGGADDDAYLNLKNYEVNPERMGADGWGWTSNNTVFADVDGDYSHVADLIATNGEPGLFFLDLARDYGRLADAPDFKDSRIKGCNPCAEQPLEPWEMCTLVETFPTHHDDIADFKQTLKHAYLYGKAVTLLPTHWPETNEVMQRNRRIGCSVSGLAQFVELHGWTELRQWLDDGYSTIKARDVQYSEWLGVRESVKMTTVKPSGTVSLVAGATPGVHWPVNAGTYIRRMRFSNVDPLLSVLIEAGFHAEPDVMNPKTTTVVSFYTDGPAVRPDSDVSLWEKAELAVLLQRWWSDNMVSCTLNFSEHEVGQIPALMAAKAGQLKTMSFLPVMSGGAAYAQMPYESVSVEEAEAGQAKVRRLDLEAVYNSGREAEGERYCTTDKCEVQF